MPKTQRRFDKTQARALARKAAKTRAPKPRTGQAPPMLDRDEFGIRFRQSFFDPAFKAEKAALGRIEIIAWQAYQEDRKAPRTVKAGPAFANPDFDLSVEWMQTRNRLRAAEARQK